MASGGRSVRSLQVRPPATWGASDQIGRIAGVRSRQTRLTQTTTRCPCLERGSHRQTTAVCIGPVTAVWHGIAGASAVFARSKALGDGRRRSLHSDRREGASVSSQAPIFRVGRSGGPAATAGAPSLSSCFVFERSVSRLVTWCIPLRERALGRSLGLAGYNFLYVIEIEIKIGYRVTQPESRDQAMPPAAPPRKEVRTSPGGPKTKKPPPPWSW